MTEHEIANELDSLYDYVQDLDQRNNDAETPQELARIKAQQTATSKRIAQLEAMVPAENKAPRKASPFCKSGGYDDCTCDRCF